MGFFSHKMLQMMPSKKGVHSEKLTILIQLILFVEAIFKNAAAPILKKILNLKIVHSEN